MAGRYADHSKVSSDQSKAEIERTLTRAGARSFGYGWDHDRRAAVIGFRLGERAIKYVLPLPDRAGREFTHTPEKGFLREPRAADAAYEQAVRQRWRALALIIKAKLEAVAAGVVTLDEEFLSATLLPDGSTVGEFVGPQIDEVYRTGGMPSLLPGASPKALAAGQERRALRDDD